MQSYVTKVYKSPLSLRDTETAVCSLEIDHVSFYRGCHCWLEDNLIILIVL